MVRNLDDLLNVDTKDTMKLVVVGANDEEVIEAINEARKIGVIEPILIGDKEKIFEILDLKGINREQFRIIDESDLVKQAEMGVKMVSSGEADFIMKGLIDTSLLLKAVLNKEWGLRTESLLSHVMLYEVSTYSKILYLTDGGMNLEPSLEDKKKIIENASVVTRALGKEEIKVAVLAAKEKVNPKMIATVHADQLKKEYENGGFSNGIIVDGPLALDLALSKNAAKVKGYESQVAGDADILVVPNIEMGNGIGKSITYLANGKSAGVVMGAKAPIVLVSRADDYKSKLYSIALGSMIANYNNRFVER